MKVYKITDFIPIKNSFKKVILFCDEERIEIKLTDKIISDYSLSLGKELFDEDVDILKEHEKISAAYNKALHYLSYKDYTEKEMKNKLLLNEDFDEILIEMVLELLIDKNLINDDEYVEHYFKKGERLGIGVHKLIYELKKKGVSPNTIDQFLETYDREHEYDKAYQMVDKYFKANSTKPIQAIIEHIKSRLYTKGFSQDTIDLVVSNYDFQISKEQTQEFLNREYDKVYRRYKNKYEGKTLKQKMIQFLIQKGYEYSDIVELIEVKESYND